MVFLDFPAKNRLLKKSAIKGENDIFQV